MAATGVQETLDAAVQAEPELLDDELYEIVDGQRIENHSMSAYAVKIASRLIRKLGAYADDRQLGEVVGEMLFRLPLKGDRSRDRRPDLAFVSYQTWPSDRPQPTRDNAWDVVPDLAGEVVSPNDFAEEQQRKVLEYFEAGVRLVWVIYPELRLIHVHEAPDRIRVLTESATLDGGIALPGFQLPLDRLFDPVAPVAR
jgi:Uma2 family endonuclease